MILEPVSLDEIQCWLQTEHHEENLLIVEDLLNGNTTILQKVMPDLFRRINHIMQTYNHDDYAWHTVVPFDSYKQQVGYPFFTAQNGIHHLAALIGRAHESERLRGYELSLIATMKAMYLSTYLGCKDREYDFCMFMIQYLKAYTRTNRLKLGHLDKFVNPI